jgi:hypothetical protein
MLRKKLQPPDFDFALGQLCEAIVQVAQHEDCPPVVVEEIQTFLLRLAAHADKAEIDLDVSQFAWYVFDRVDRLEKK